jgi:DNA-binding GntR family transcriptional regulator
VDKGLNGFATDMTLGNAKQEEAAERRDTVVDRLRRIISDEIVTGALGPGVRLDEQGLADRFSVSRTPVREALSQLVGLGLVEKRPHKGVVVLMQSYERLLQLFEVMAELEGACARFAAERMTRHERAHLRRMHATAMVLVEENDTEKYAEHNTEFHRLIYDGTHNPALVETAFEARRKVFHFRRAQFRLANRVQLSQEEHECIVAAISRGDPNSAYESAKQHILTVREAAAQLIAATPPLAVRPARLAIGDRRPQSGG